MRKLYFFLTICCALAVASSCSLKEDENFEDTASKRSEDNIASVERILNSASNGWQMEYFGGTLGYGGYNILVKFDGSNATFASEKMGPYHVAGIDTEGNAVTTTSHYKLEQSMGTIISFDEWNDTFHYFSMPNNPDGYGDTNEGFNGDFEFRVMKATSDSIILRGKKHNARVIMTPIPADRSWGSILKEISETESYMSSSSYTLSGEDRKDNLDIQIRNSYRCLVFTYIDSTELKQTITAPYIVKNDGYVFYAPVTVNGMELDGLWKGESDDYFIFRNNPRLQLDSYMPTLAEHLSTGLWCIRYGSLGEYATPKWDAMLEKLKTAGKNKTEIKIYYAYIGVAQNKLACHMVTSTDQPYQGFTVSDVNAAGDQVTIKWNSANTAHNRAGQDYYNKYGWKEALEPFYGKYGRTFKLSCDNPRHPSYLTLTDINEPTNVITVYYNSYYFMDNMDYYRED